MNTVGGMESGYGTRITAKHLGFGHVICVDESVLILIYEDHLDHTA